VNDVTAWVQWKGSHALLPLKYHQYRTCYLQTESRGPWRRARGDEAPWTTLGCPKRGQEYNESELTFEFVFTDLKNGPSGIKISNCALTLHCVVWNCFCEEAQTHESISKKKKGLGGQEGISNTKYFHAAQHLHKFPQNSSWNVTHFRSFLSLLLRLADDFWFPCFYLYLIAVNFFHFPICLISKYMKKVFKKS